MRVDAWELPTHGRGDQSQHLTAVLHKLCSGLQPGRGTKLSPLSLLAAKTGQNSPCMHQTAQNARILASRANFVTRAPQTGHAGRILSRKTLRSGNAGRVPSRLQLRGRTLTSVCARKTLDTDVGGTAHTHIIGPTSGHRARVRQGPTHRVRRSISVFTGTRHTQPPKTPTFPREKAEKSPC